MHGSVFCKFSPRSLVPNPKILVVANVLFYLVGEGEQFIRAESGCAAWIIAGSKDSAVGREDAAIDSAETGEERNASEQRPEDATVSHGEDSEEQVASADAVVEDGSAAPNQEGVADDGTTEDVGEGGVADGSPAEERVAVGEADIAPPEKTTAQGDTEAAAAEAAEETKEEAVTEEPEKPGERSHEGGDKDHAAESETKGVDDTHGDDTQPADRAASNDEKMASPAPDETNSDGTDSVLRSMDFFN